MSLLSDLGPLLVFAFMPYAVVLAIDALGWRLLWSLSTRRRAGLSHALMARLAGEAVAQTIPWVALAGEAASAWWLARRTEVPVGHALGTLVVRRLLLAPGHGLVLAVAAVAALQQPSLPELLGAGMAAAALLLPVAAAGGSRFLRDGAPFSRIQVALARWGWVRRSLRGCASSGHLLDADREAERLLTGPWRRRVAAVLCFAFVFVAEACETYFLLRLLGVHVSPSAALTLESAVGLARSVAVFAPAGLGVQELGYFTLLRLMGVPNGIGAAAAFVVLKRLKDVVWLAAGWLVLLNLDAPQALKAAQRA